MKNEKNLPQGQQPKPGQNKNRPEIRDNMDSREGEEQMVKGDDITHNKKEVKSKKQGKK